MGNNLKKPNNRRAFFSSILKAGTNTKIKMLTADGKLVEIDREVLQNIQHKKKASNQEIFDWMDNPSKD